MNNVRPLRERDVNLRVAPHNITAERALLGALLAAPQHIERVAQIVTPEAFAEPAASVVFKAMVDIAESGAKVDFVTMHAHVGGNPVVSEAMEGGYLRALLKSMVLTSNVVTYATLIANLYRRRLAIDVMADALERAYADEQAVDPFEVIEQAIGGLTDINASAQVDDGVSFGRVLADVYEQHRKVDRGEIEGASSGLPSLDSQMGLLQPSDLIVVGGRPGMGKSVLATVLAYHAAQAYRAERVPRNVVFFSAEMSSQQLVSRIVTARTGVQGYRNRTSVLSGREWDEMANVEAELGSLPIDLHDGAAPTLSGILSKCRQLRRRGGVGLIVVDYLQLMAVEKSRKLDGRTQEISFIARGLKNIAKLMKCPVVALSQISRGVEQRENKRPAMSDLRESGEIEAAADTILMLYREAYYLETQKPTASEEILKWSAKVEKCRNQVEVIIAKARHGSTGTVFLNFDGKRTWITDPALETGFLGDLV